MQWRARVIAPILAVVLGATGGVATALMRDPGTSVTPADDPLGVGVPLQNLGCTGQSILVVGYGNSGAQLGNGISANKPSHPHYLSTADSCRTQLGPERGQDPAYVAYLGPFPDMQSPCGVRMTALHRTDFVARLHAGNTTLVKCPCQLEPESAPQLTYGQSVTSDDQVWIRSLQGMLHDYALSQDDGSSFTHDDITGTFSETTRRYVLQKFQVPAGYLGQNGNLDTETWRIILKKTCAIYDY